MFMQYGSMFMQYGNMSTGEQHRTEEEEFQEGHVL